MSAFRVVPTSLDAPVQADAVAAETFAGAARALRRHAVDTGRSDSGDAVSEVVRALTVEADGLAVAAQADADALRSASGAYRSVDRRAMER